MNSTYLFLLVVICLVSVTQIVKSQATINFFSNPFKRGLIRRKTEDSSPYLLPTRFHANWTFIEMTREHNVPIRTIEGETYYEASTSNDDAQIIEIWKESCIPIWPNRETMPKGGCAFLDLVNGAKGRPTSYMLYKKTPQSEEFDGCCIFGHPWSAPSRDSIIKHLQPNPNITTESLQWFQAGEPPAGPFTYAFWKDKQLPETKTNQIFGFGFATVTGYGVHRFYNVDTTIEKSKYDWKLPQQCIGQIPSPHEEPFPGYNCPFPF